MIVRFFLSLYATLPAALLTLTVVQLFPPTQLPPMAVRPEWLVWAFIACWLAMSALLALIRRSTVMWRTALFATAGLLALVASCGISLGVKQRMSFAVAFGLLGASCMMLAWAIGVHRVRRNGPLRHPRREKSRHTERAAVEGTTAVARSAGYLSALLFLMAAGLFIEAFRLAHIVNLEPMRGSGMVGMVAAFLLLLPAATLSSWLPRTAAVLLLCAGMVYGALAFKSGLVQWWGGALLSAGMSFFIVFRPRRSRDAQQVLEAETDGHDELDGDIA